MIVLTKEQVVALHTQIITETGGETGIRDDGLLDSALHAPFQSYANKYMYPSIQQEAARLGFGLVTNHAFIDGNKRIGAHAMLVFLALNGIELEYSQDELVNIFLNIATGKSSLNDLLHWIIDHQI